jgi:ribosomal-protein-alanine N-acetyltransferase
MNDLATNRLFLRKLSMEDASDMFEYASDPQVSRYTVWEPHDSLDCTRTFIKSVIEGYHANEPEPWGIFYKQAGKLIGTAGFFDYNMKEGTSEIHYAISRAYWGKGLMTEAVREIIRYGFENLQLKTITAKCMVNNLSSEKVMQKAGMAFAQIRPNAIEAKGAKWDAKVYSINRPSPISSPSRGEDEGEGEN